MTATVAEDAGADAPPPAGEVPVKARHTARWVGVFVLVIGAGLIAVLASRPPAVVVEAQNPVVGRPAPAISGVTLEGTHFTLPRVPGRFVVLNFFADWCEPCQAEGPNLVQFQFQHQAAGDATMVSVVFDDTESAARNYQESLGVTWPTLADPGGDLALSYGVRAPPTTFVIAPDGRVAAAIIAPVTAADLDQIIAKAKATGA